MSRFNEQATYSIEEPFEAPEFMSAWTDKQKAEFAFHLLTSLPPYEVIQVVDRISPYLHRNILCQLPHEIAIHVLSFLDSHSLIQACLVSRAWNALCEEQTLWKNLFESQGWLYDKEEMDAYLEETSKEEISYTNSSGNNDSTTHSKNSDNIISSIPITRTSSALISPNSLSVLSSLKNRLSPSVQHAQSNKVKNKTNALANRQVISFGDHYNPRTDMRFINWKKLYEKRYMIEQRWLSGQCKMYSFPPLPCPIADLHTEGIYCLQLDKKKMVTGSRDKTIKIWDLETGSCKMTITGHTRSVLCLQYDNDTIVSGSSDATLIVTELETGKLKQKLLGHEDSVLNLRLVKSDRIISCSKDRTVRLWDKNTGQCLRVYQGHRAAVNAVQWLNHIIVSASGDRTIKMWDMETGKCLRTLIAHTRGVACIEFDGERIVSGSSDKTIKVWDANTGDCIYTLAGHTELVRTIQLDSVADRIISGCYDGQLKIWDLKEGRLLRDLGQAVDGRILHLKFNGTKLACCSNMVRVVIYDFADGINTRFLL